MTEGQVVWICVASVGLSALSNSRNLFGRMQHLQCSSKMRLLMAFFIEDRRVSVQRKTPGRPPLTSRGCESLLDESTCRSGNGQRQGRSEERRVGKECG